MLSVALRLSGLGVLGVVGWSRSTVSGSDCQVMCVVCMWVLSRYSAWKTGFCVAKSMANMLFVKNLCSGAYIEQRVSCGAVREYARGADFRTAGRASIKAHRVSRMAGVHQVVLVKKEHEVKETAVHEVLQNDVDEQAMDTVNKGWSKDQWMSGVLERAIRIVARSAAKGEQEFQLSPLLEDSVKFAVSEDKELGTFYRDRRDTIFTDGHLGKYFPIDNVELKPTIGANIHVQGTQRPDSVSLLKLTNQGEDKKVCICFEGDAHNLDANKANAGMFSYEKMFQDVSLCHDVNRDVPGIFITSVLLKHDKLKFPTFADWAQQFLKEHVLLVEQLLQYISNKETSSIHRALQRIDKNLADTSDFDFYCWINAQGDEGKGWDAFEKNVDECFDLMLEKPNEDELKGVLELRKMYNPPANDWVSEKLAQKNNVPVDGLFKNKFNAMAIRTNLHGMPVVIFAVPRVKMADIDDFVRDAAHPCSGMWYPMHVHRYVASLNARDMKNFLVSDGKTNSFQDFSVLPFMDTKNILKQNDFDAKYKNQMTGQLLFTLPWLWINIGFLCWLKSSLTYNWVQGRARAKNTIPAYIAFTRRHATHVNSRDNVKNDMQMFPDTSTSLFAHLCRARQTSAGVDEELGLFLQNKCGWTNATSASSPAVFFALLGVQNLITAHTLAKRCSGAPNKYSTEIEKVKDTFPLAAQVEIDYALECLCRHYYFAQDKSAVQDDVVTRAEFDRMKRKLQKEVEVAQAKVKDEKVEEQQKEVTEEQNERENINTYQVDKNGYHAIEGEQISDAPTSDNMKFDWLKHKQLVVNFMIDAMPREKRWYRGKVINYKSKDAYQIYFDDDDIQYVHLRINNYGYQRKWVIVAKV